MNLAETPKTDCRTPTQDRDGVTRIPSWKFDVLRAAILDVLSEDDVRFSDLKERVRPRLSQETLSQLGSLGWHVTTVKLELEVRGEVIRRGGKGPQVIGLPGDDALP